ncbi:MAG: hypothetical protein A2163_08010 [Actinobacteria bacterium RBG_13_35_12]|nr:MAG: hypothetical protein A2163_08010 [Actinobacteria bacterium RBG_13_35_12]
MGKVSKFLLSGAGFDFDGKTLSIYRIYQGTESGAKESVELTKTQMHSLTRFLIRCLIKRKYE